MTVTEAAGGRPERIDAENDDAFAGAVRAAMRTYRSPVAILSTFDGDLPVGCTVSAFLSLSLRPPSLLVSLQSGSSTLRHIRASSHFGLSVLSDQQATLIDVFTRGHCRDRFRETGFSVMCGVPLVDGAPVGFACCLGREIAVGDHVLITGEISAVQTATSFSLSVSATSPAGTSRQEASS